MRPDFSRNPREIAKSSRSAIYTYRFQLLVVNSIGTLLAQRLQRSAPGDDLIEHGEVIVPSFLTMTSFVFDDDIVRAAESFTFEAIGQDCTLTIFFDPID